MLKKIWWLLFKKKKTVYKIRLNEDNFVVKLYIIVIYFDNMKNLYYVLCQQID